MADNLSPEERSRHMACIRSSGTRPERVVELNLRASGIRFRRQADLPGKPDFLLIDLRVALFVHGCMWHGCERHFRLPKTNTAFWADKIRRNRLRDERVAARLRSMGYAVRQLWEHDILV